VPGSFDKREEDAIFYKTKEGSFFPIFFSNPALINTALIYAHTFLANVMNGG
jgi:hypothetical protein